MAMLQNSTESDSLTVSSAQATVIAELVAGCTVTAAAEKAGVHRTTVYHWLEHDADFVAELNRTRWEYREEFRVGMEALAARAAETLLEAIGTSGPVTEFNLHAATAALRLTRDAAEDHGGPTDPAAVRAEWARREASGEGTDAATALGKRSGVRRRRTGSW
jgi:hypothetical protein